MLKREEAQKLLEQEGSKTWRDEARALIAGEVPESLRATAYALLDCDEHGQALTQRTQAQQERHQRIVAQGWASFGALESSQRLTILSALLPGSAPSVEAAWQLLGRLPYQTGYRRKAFRLRVDDAAIGAVRTQWLQTMLANLGAYRHKEVSWLAAWAPYLGYYGGYVARELGILCAATIDGGGPDGEAVFETLTASARGEHPIGAMGRHVTTGLLVASRPDGWAFIERLLLAAQREEGLRQVILETVDEAHPEAFRRLLRLILDQDLLRFSATIRAADVWFGFGWDVDDARAVREALGEVRTLLDAPQARIEALLPGQEARPGEPEPAPGPLTAAARAARKKAEDRAIAEGRAAAQRVYLALWAVAFEDALAAVEAAGPLLDDDDPLRRLAVVALLGQLDLPRARVTLLPLLHDADQRVALCAFEALSTADATLALDLFERYEQLLSRLDDNAGPRESGLWPWFTLRSGAQEVADALLGVLAERPPTRLLPHLSRMSTWRQTEAAKLLAALPEWDAPIREIFFRMAGDRSSYVRDTALELIASRPITHDEALPLEGLLTRKSSETRRALLTMLLKQPDDAALGSAGRLLVARHPLQRMAGLDVLREMTTAGRAIPACQHAARGYQEARQTLSTDEQTLLTAILDAGQPEQAVPTLENVLGLIDPADLTPPVTPRRLDVQVDTPAVRTCLLLLDELIEQQSTTPVIVTGWQGGSEQLLGNMNWLPNPDTSVTAQEDRANLPLADLWLQWDRERPAASRDDDGLELVRALLVLANSRISNFDAARTGLSAALVGMFSSVSQVTSTFLAGFSAESLATPTAGELPTESGAHGLQLDRLRHRQLVTSVLGWLVRLKETPPAGAVDLLLDSVETALALIPRQQLEEWIAAQATEGAWRFARVDPRSDGSLGLLAQHLAQHPASWTAAHHLRYWRLLHWLDQPLPGAPRQLPALEVVLRAYHAGGASEADILEHLVAPAAGHRFYGQAQAHDLWLLSARATHPLIERYPVLRRLIPLLRGRILEIELVRGEMPTPATALALSLRYAGGLPIFVRLLGALASGDLVRGYLAASESRAGALSHLLRSTYPAPDDTPAAFAQGIAAAGIEAGRLVAAAVYAPQWARYVEQTLGWPQLEEAVWWIHAHTKDRGWTVDQALREAWQAQVAERTPLGAQDLIDGAVDVEWFWRSYGDLGGERWNELYAAAKYASSGGGHAWARLCADAMTGAIEGRELLSRIDGKRNQDAVRALGLLPLPNSADASEATVRERYQAIQEFLRTSKQFGAQRRASEELAARIGLENLARTAGYADPIRLQWAMETQLAADLRDGPVVVADGDVLVTLSLNALSAEPEIAVSKNGKPLKALPARVKTNEAIAALSTRKREIERQVSRMGRSLEDAMCRGDRFTAAEIAGLLQHPVLSRLLRNLVFIEDNTADGQPDQVLGYPVPGTGLAAAALGLNRATPRPAPAAPRPRPQPVPDGAGWRTFAFKDATSDKFWRIRVDGATMAVNYGRAGTTGQHQRKELAGTAEAQREAEKQIREKRAKGYVETTASVQVAAVREAAGEGEQPMPVAPAADHPVPVPVAVPDDRDQGTSQNEGAVLLQFRAHDGTTRALAGTTATLRLAHPHDLLRSGAWPAWQHDCFASERIQPFKQVFRELYVLTQNETRVGDEATSSRYSGQQVQPRQALALFGQRGWVSSPEEGVRRTFHDVQLTARVDFDGGYLTPAEVEGLTVDRVSFTRRGAWQPLPLAEVPPRIFSEVMRDLDLVVSVAHRGGVDPEASASTVEMRAALLQETCTLLRLQNVSLRSAHALIDGTLGSYSVHLGSAVVHRQPGGAVCIVPVHSQHRGRLFLPFADDDPRTAEVISKVVLLARDGEIKDPSILEQIL